MAGSDYDLDEEDDRSFLRRNWVMLLVGTAILGGGVFAAVKMSGAKASAPPPKDLSIIRVSLPPLPPPPPPPVVKPKEEPPKEQPKKDEMTPLDQKEIAEKPPEPDKPKDEPPAPMATGIKGAGGPDMGLASSGNGIGGGNGTIGGNGGGGNGTKFGWYAGQVQSRVTEAMRNNSRTRKASLIVQARIWVDANGRIERARLVGSSGDTSMDEEITSQVLTGLQMSSPPPEGMKMPITLRITARKAG